MEKGSALIRLGYRIVPIPKGRKGPVMAGWQKLVATLDDLPDWSVEYENVGVITRDTPAVDLDILDESLAREMEAYVVSLLGDAPVRIGRAPKRLLAFRTTTPFTKVQATAVDPNGVKHKVEILGEGQQFVAYGTHPDTGRPYQWVSFEELADIPATELPLITQAQAQRIVDTFVKRARERGWTIGAQRAAAPVEDDDDPFAGVKPVLQINDEQIRDVLRYAGDREEYDTWVLVGMALHHQFHGGERGLELWHEWSSDALNYDADALDAKWESFNDVRGSSTVTLATFVKRAREEREAESRRVFIELQDAVKTCEDSELLFGEVCRQIGKTELAQHQRDILAKLIQDQGKKLTGARVNISTVRAAIKQRETKTRSSAGGEELELRLARAVLDRHFAGGKHIARFAKMWWVYRKGLWAKAEDEYVDSLALETLQHLRKTGSPDAAAFVADMEENAKVGKINAAVTVMSSLIVRLIARDSASDPLGLTRSIVPSIINCTNCELWFDEEGSMQRREHDPENFLTSQLACEFDARAESPVWDAAIERVFSQCDEPAEMIRHFYEIMGYLIQPTRNLPMWVMIRGPGGNGKSFLLDIISTLMGRRSVMNMPLSQVAKGSDSHFTDALQGKLMLLDDDVKSDIVLPDDWLKKLSEAKAINANPKNKSPYTFIARSIPVALANRWPSTTDLSQGIRRRAQIIEMAYTIRESEKNPNHRTIIVEKELPGVLNHLVAGWQRVLARGTRLDPPAECVRSKETWLAHSNTTARFVAYCVERTGNWKDEVSAVELYGRYRDWVMENEAQARPLGRNTFYEKMEELGFQRKNFRNSWRLTGLRLREDGDSIEDW